MRSAVLRDGTIAVVEVAEPVPGAGQVLCRTLACGICGSDLHYAEHGRRLVELGGPGAGVDLARDVFMGHELAAEVVAAGPGTDAPAPGTVVTSTPRLLTAHGVEQIAYSNDHPAGFSEYLLLSAELLNVVPDGVDPEHAALTEPLAVGLHAVARSRIVRGESAVVLGCGPIGLAVIAALRLRGVEAIVAADLSPARRALALELGAAHAVDPRAEPAIETWRHTAGASTPVIYEAVGARGMLQAALADCPRGGRVVVVGVCMEPDEIVPAVAIMKELEVQFVRGSTAQEFAQALAAIAAGRVPVAAMITGRVGLGGVGEAFAALRDPERHCKVIVDPRLP
jgi:threonine dehydrogenase-like Zn-dependent dehydrogenase